jgi:S-adenosylmethionine synthetase
MSTEAAAGKNPVSHVGKIYNLLAQQMATHICESVTDVAEASVWLCSQIGRPLADPWSVAVEFIPRAGASIQQLAGAIEDIISGELSSLPQFVAELTRGEKRVC